MTNRFGKRLFLAFFKTYTEKVVLARVTRLKATINGIVAGLVAGLEIFIATTWLILRGPIGAEGEPVVGLHLSLLGQFFIGYRVTFVGSLIGFAYGFVCGFLCSVAKMYNWIVDCREGQSQGSG